MDMPLVLEKSSVIRAPVRALFDFHQDPANLRRINPPGVRVSGLRLPSEWKAGARLGVTVSLLGLIRQDWEVCLEEVSAPVRLVDVALQGPYRAWRHVHEFTEIGPGLSRLVDRVEYLPPWGAWGRWLDGCFFRPQLRVMFAWRHRQTRRWLERPGAGPQE
jgi:ligand-binding SRPBCC domain-containing protein